MTPQQPIADFASTLRELTPDVYAALDLLGSRLTARLSARIATDGLDASVVNVGSLFQVFRGDGGAAFAPAASRPSELYLGLLLEGYMIAPRGMGAIPAVATEQDVDDLADAMGRVLAATVDAPATPVGVGA